MNSNAKAGGWIICGLILMAWGVNGLFGLYGSILFVGIILVLAGLYMPKAVKEAQYEDLYDEDKQ